MKIRLALTFLVIGCLCCSCAAMQSAFGIPPTDTEVQNCATWIKQQADAKALPSAQLSADLTQLHATPPTIPTDCRGHT